MCPASPLARSWGTMRRQKLLTTALGILAVMIFLAAVGPIIAPHDPEAVLRETLLDERGEMILNAQGDPRTQLANLRAPSGEYWFGTDEKALDVLQPHYLCPARRSRHRYRLHHHRPGRRLRARPGGGLCCRSRPARRIAGRGPHALHGHHPSLPRLYRRAGPRRRDRIRARQSHLRPLLPLHPRSSSVTCERRPCLCANLPSWKRSVLSATQPGASCSTTSCPTPSPPPRSRARPLWGYAILLTAGLSFVGGRRRSAHAGVGRHDQEWGSSLCRAVSGGPRSSPVSRSD